MVSALCVLKRENAVLPYGVADDFCCFHGQPQGLSLRILFKKRLESFPKQAVLLMNYSINKVRDLFNGNQLFLAAHIRTKGNGDINAAVGVEVIFKECDEHSRRSNDGIIERMGKIFFAVLAVDSDCESASLCVAAVGA